MNRATALCIEAMASSAMADLARLRSLVAPYIDLPASPGPLGEDAAARPSPAAAVTPAAAATLPRDAQRGLKRDLSTPRGHADPDAAAGKQDDETRCAAAASPHTRAAGGGDEPQPAIRAGEPPAHPSPRPAAAELRPVQIPAEGAPASHGQPSGFSSLNSPAGSQASPALSKRDRFRLLWAEGKSAGAIGAELGWKRTTVYTEAYKLRLPQRSYRRQSRPTFSHETPATSAESREAIASFIERHGVTKCPPAVSVAPSQGVTVSPETRAAHVTLAAQREADRVAEQQKRHARKSA